jgi:5-methylcytosine-specific restriction protein A
MLKPGDTIANDELSRIFKCATQGGMRRSHHAKALILISDRTKYLHQDRWISEAILHYTGMGLTGDQSIDYRQNKTLRESANNGVTPYLFEVYQPRRYLFRGNVALAGQPFEEYQPGMDGKPRTVWVFPLKLIGDAAGYRVPDDLIARARRRHERKARLLSDEELYIMAVHTRRKNPAGNRGAPPLEATNVYVAELTRRRAAGICQLCDRPAPFHDKMDEPYLEHHHIVWKSRGGTDTVDNSVALCPNCHKKMHILNLKDDRKKLLGAANKSCCQLTIDGGVVYV